jgi:hypothetical protein
MNFANLNIGRRMGAGFAVLQGFIIAVTLLGVGGMEQIHLRVKKIAGQNNVEMRLANTMRISSFERVLAMRNLQIVLISEKLATVNPDQMAPQPAALIHRETERVVKERANFKDALQTLQRT